MTADGRAVPEIAPGFRLQWEEAQQCHVLLYPEGMVKLSASAAAILNLCDGKQDVDKIIANLQRCYPDASELAVDVRQFFQEAGERGWIRWQR